MDMGKIVVIYESKYGRTKKYAQWLAESLEADLFEKNKFNVNLFSKYDTIIYGGGLYAGGISGANLIKKAFDTIKDKKLIIFSCGLADPNEASNIEGINKGINRIFSSEQKEQIKFFYLRGGIDYKELGIVHKIMMHMLKRMLKNKPLEILTEENKQFLETYGKKVEFVDKETIMPIVDHVRGL